VTTVLPALWDFLDWAMRPTWNGFPVVVLAELAMGGVLWLLMARAASPRARATRASTAVAVRRPG
jgi:hypothetical protein